MSSEDNLDRLARRASHDPYFFAHCIAHFAARNRLDDDQLCELWGISRKALRILRLCRRPLSYPDLARMSRVAGAAQEVIALLALPTRE